MPLDREGSDLRAFKRSVKILKESKYPLVIFPEGEVYHLNDRVTPFRDGAAMIALSAARLAKRPVYCVPCALKYRYVEDPGPELETLMTDLELKVNWRPNSDTPLAERILKYAGGQMALKEVEYLCAPQEGTLQDRLAGLREHILSGLETHYPPKTADPSIPERIKETRRACLERLQADDLSAGERSRIEIHLDDVFVVVQLFSYTGDYLTGSPSIERVAETMDKLEEDVLGIPSAHIRGTRRVVVALDAPIDTAAFSEGTSRRAAPKLTDEIERRVQALLNELNSEKE